jgi:spoIIIJ-associated protein
MEKRVKDLQKLSDELLSLMGTKAKTDVSYDKTNECYLVNVSEGDETGLLIGKKGETLLSLQTILGILLKQETGEWERVTVNIGDYLEKEEEYLKNLAQKVRQQGLKRRGSHKAFTI